MCFLCKVSCLEIYQEVITDLLCPERTRLQLREDLRHGIYVDLLSEEVVTCGEASRLVKSKLEVSCEGTPFYHAMKSIAGASQYCHHAAYDAFSSPIFCFSTRQGCIMQPPVPSMPVGTSRARSHSLVGLHFS